MAETMTISKLEQFWDDLKRKLYAYQMDELKDKLGFTKYQWTTVQSGSRDFELVELEIVAQYTGISLYDLVVKYGLGLTRMSAAEADAIRSKAA